MIPDKSSVVVSVNGVLDASSSVAPSVTKSAKKFITHDIAKNFVLSLESLKYIYFSSSGWYMYDEKTGWRSIHNWDIQAEINKFCWQEVNIINSGKKQSDEAISLSTDKLKVVFELVQTALTVKTDKINQSKTIDPSVWLKFESGYVYAESAEGWIACDNVLLNVKEVASALYRGEPIPAEAIKPLSPELFVLGRVPCDFKPDSICPRWLQFVDEVTSDEIDRVNLQKMFGLSLTFDRRFNSFFVLFGIGGTGKSTCLEILRLLNSGCVCSVPLTDFSEKFSLFALTENRVNVYSDLPAVFETMAAADKLESVLKNLTCCESVQVEQKHLKPITRRLVSLAIFGSNTIPRFPDRSGAIRGRFKLIPFMRQFRGTGNEDKDLSMKLMKELPGILIWSLVGYGRLLKEGFSESGMVQTMLHDAERQSSSTLSFCEDCLEKSVPDSFQLSEIVYQAYCSYCIKNGLTKIASNRAIPEIVQQMGASKGRIRQEGRRVAVLYGIRFAIGATDSYSGNY